MITTMAPTTTLAPSPFLNSRQGLADYCLRSLGQGAIDINVTQQQVDDRINEAIQFYHEYHHDGVERMYLKSLTTGSTIRTLEPVGPQFSQNEVIIGQTSGAAAFFYEVVPAVVPNPDIPLGNIAYVPFDPTFFYIWKTTAGITTPAFIPGETIVGQASGVTGTIAPNGFTVGNWDQQFFPIDDSVLGINNIFILGPGTAGLNARNIFDVVYQFRLNDMYDLMSTDLIYYAQVKLHLSLLDMLLPGVRSTRFNRKQGKLFIDFNWYEQLLPGTYVIAECYRALNPQEYTRVYNDYFLKKYAKALIKRQWGENLKIFNGIQILGGVTVNGKEIYDEAIEEIKELNEEMFNTWQGPIFFEVG
jgi:hypothetical protein